MIELIFQAFKKMSPGLLHPSQQGKRRDVKGGITGFEPQFRDSGFWGWSSALLLKETYSRTAAFSREA